MELNKFVHKLHKFKMIDEKTMKQPKKIEFIKSLFAGERGEDFDNKLMKVLNDTIFGV